MLESILKPEFQFAILFQEIMSLKTNEVDD